MSTPRFAVPRENQGDKRKKFSNSPLLQCEIVPFLDKRIEEKQLVRIGGLPYVRERLGDTNVTDFSWPYKVFMAKINRKIVGWITYKIDGDEMASLKIAIDVKNSEKGVSRALVAKCVEEARRNGLKRVSGLIYYDNSLSQGLFRSMGFTFEWTSDGLFKGYYVYLDL